MIEGESAESSNKTERSKGKKSGPIMLTNPLSRHAVPRSKKRKAWQKKHGSTSQSREPETPIEDGNKDSET